MVSPLKRFRPLSFESVDTTLSETLELAWSLQPCMLSFGRVVAEEVAVVPLFCRSAQVYTYFVYLSGVCMFGGCVCGVCVCVCVWRGGGGRVGSVVLCV